MKIILGEDQYNRLIEDIELDEVKTEQDWLNDFSSKFPNWDYSKSKIFKDQKNITRINNIYCTIHNHYFPEGDKMEGLTVYDHIKGTGCKDCGKESFTKNFLYDNEKWRAKLSKKFKDTCDFSKSKFVTTSPQPKGPIVSHIYCKIHKKYFDGGIDNIGVRAVNLLKSNTPCPYCKLDGKVKWVDIDNTKVKDTNLSKNHIPKLEKGIGVGRGRGARFYEDWIELFKSNENNKNNDYSKSKIWYEDNGLRVTPRVYNVYCKVKGLNGKPHGFFAEKKGLKADNHMNGYGTCPKCVCESKTKENIKEYKIKHGNKYVYDKVDFCDPETMIKKEGINGDQYTRKVLIGCKEHGYFFQDSYQHKKGTGCPVCRESKGENYINELLTKLKLKFLREKRFVETGNVEFDFYIPKLKLLIEYDGIGHFEPTFGSSDYSRNQSYNSTFRNDNFKNNFVKSKKNNLDGLRLIRIPYNMKFNEINVPLFDAIENTQPNQVKYIGDYPKRQGRKESESQFKINETKLSFENILTEKLKDMRSIPIYHHTTEERALGIMNSNMLKGSSVFPEILNLDPTLKHSKHKTMVSFTRDKNFVPDASIGNSGDGPRVKPDTLNVIFVADRSRLKSRYRVVPFDYSTLADKAWMDAIPRTRKNPEVEERVLTDRIYPLRQYLTNIIYTGQDPEVQKKIDEYLSGIK
jgi:very-short-patch-repair endonuclease